MNIRKEFREAFRQYRRRLGLPLPCPNSDIRAGELCFFNVDGTVVSLGNVLDCELDEVSVTKTVDNDPDPIISNGMRCRSLSESELEWFLPHEKDANSSYEFSDNDVNEAYMLSREKFSVPDYAILASSLIKTEVSYSTAMKWINENAKAVNNLLSQYNVDPDLGLILVLTQWSAPGYSRVVIPSNLAEEGIIMGLSSGSSWVEGHPPEGKALKLTMIDHFDVLSSYHISNISERNGVNALC
jgi:hypothetical protein